MSWFGNSAAFSFFVCFVLLAAIGSGCDERAGSRADGTSSALKPKPGPEESFELIFKTFQRGVEQIPIGFVLPQGNGHSMMVGKNEVSYELMPPVKEGDIYKAVITVDSRSRYSIQRTRDEDTDSDQDSRSESSASDLLDENGEASGVEILDSDLVAAPNAENNRALSDSTDQAVARRPDEDKREYELAYNNGRWELITKLDPETEQSIQNAFNQALKTQI